MATLKTNLIILVTLFLCVSGANPATNSFADTDPNTTAFNPVDITPDWFNFTPKDIYVKYGYAFIAGGPNGLHVFDVDSPARPRWISKYPEIKIANDIDVSGPFAFIAADQQGLVIVDIHKPESLQTVKTIDVSGEALACSVDQDIACVISDNRGSFTMTMLSIDPEGKFEIVKSVPIMLRASGIYVKDGMAYVLGGIAGVQIFDIDPISDTVLIKTIDTPGSASSAFKYGNLLYIADGREGVCTIDLANLQAQSVPKPVFKKEHAGGIYIEENIAYISGAGGLSVIDFKDLENPKRISYLQYYYYFPNLFVYKNYAYVVTESGFMIVDVNEPMKPILMSQTFNPGNVREIDSSKGYFYTLTNTSRTQIFGYLEPDAPIYVSTVDQSVEVSQTLHGDYLYLSDSTRNLSVYSVMKPESPEFVTSTGNDYPNGTFVTDDYIFISEAMIYIFKNPVKGEKGLVNKFSSKEFNAGDPSRRLIYIDNGYSYTTHNGHLHIVDIDPPETASLVKSMDVPGYPNSLCVSKGYAYMGLNAGVKDNRFLVIDVDPPTDSRIVAELPCDAAPSGIAVRDNFAFMVGSGPGLTIMDISNPADIKTVTELELESRGSCIVVDGNYALIGGPGGVRIVKLT